MPISADGALLPSVLAVLDKIAEHDLVLATGHSSPEESLMLVREARERGIGRIMVTHPLPPPVGMSIEQQKRAAAWGALLEYPVGNALGSNPTWEGTSEAKLRAYVEAIRAVGPEHVVVSSDLGQSMNPIHNRWVGRLPGSALASRLHPRRGRPDVEVEPRKAAGVIAEYAQAQTSWASCA